MRPSRRLIGCLTVLAALASVALSAAPASAVPVPPGRLTLTVAPQTLTSSTGKTLTVNIGEGGGAVTVSVSTPGQPETHTWSFPDPNATEISYDPDARTGALTTGTALAPFGGANLKLTPVGPQTVVGCGRTRTDVQPVTVTGSLSFLTHSAWGQVGGTKPLTFTGNSTLSIFDGNDKLCGSTLPPCVVTSTWEAHNIASDLMGFTQFIGTSTTVGTTTTSTLQAKRLAYLAAPSGATRTDLTVVPIANPTFTYTDPTAAVAVPSSGADVTGGAKLGTLSENAMPALNCGDGQHRTVKTEWAATYKNGVPPFVLSEQIEGNLKLNNVAGASNKANATIDRIVTIAA